MPLFGSLQDFWDALVTLALDDGLKATQPALPITNMGVTVLPGAHLPYRVVEMEDFQVL